MGTLILPHKLLAPFNYLPFRRILFCRILVFFVANTPASIIVRGIHFVVSTLGVTWRSHAYCKHERIHNISGVITLAVFLVGIAFWAEQFA